MKQEQKNHVSADALIQLLKGAKSIRWQLALGVVMSLVLVVCALIIPTQMGALVQILIDYFDAPETGTAVLAQLAPGLLALAGVYILRAAVSYGKMQLLNRAVSRYFTCNLRIQISDKIQRLPVSFVDHTPVGDILSRMTEDVSRIGGSLHTVLDTITGGFLQILAIAVVMFLQNWQLSLAVIAFMPVSIWLSAKIAGRSETYFHQMFKQSGELYSVVEEAYTNYATTKAYNLEEHCAERHAQINDARRVSEAKATYLSAIVQPVIAASNSLAYIAINLLGGWLIVRQGVPVGVIVTLVLFAVCGVMTLGVIRPAIEPAMWPVACVFAVLFAIALIVSIYLGRAKGSDLGAFLAQSASAVCLIGLLATSMFPTLVVADPAGVGASITAATAASSEISLAWMTGIACIGVPLVLVYHIIVYRTFRGRLSEEDVA